MDKEKIQSIINEVYPKIQKHYGYSKYHFCTPLIELHHNLYSRLSEEDYGEDVLLETEFNPDAEFDREDNTIVLYWPKMKTKKLIIQSLIHEYQHYLQSPLWMARYYKMGYDYNNHPYELSATAEEENWKKFA